ncbi:mRNA cleavage and polyadenylation factor subunit [Spiromyces aspiralis]|uniref:mRNA cleavage and polyadenylation factor subunit n=1 Tax=Spiromyces aspiralis TaxID=68401 RepID=A0ACC1HHA1_9FUNG|nr:mRNA cleavage and polyadenylation factor subunit [Spiromyces aspiralis]
MYTYFREILPPTAVTAAEKGSFTAPGSNDLFVAKDTALELYTVEGDIATTPDTQGKAWWVPKLRLMSMIEFVPEIQNIATVSLHYYEHDKLKRKFVNDDARCDIRVDPRNRCAAMHFYQDQLAILPFYEVDTIHLEDEEKTKWPYQPSFVIDTWGQDYKVRQIRDVVFLHGYMDPVIAVLHQKVGGWAGTLGSLTEERDLCALTIFSIDLVQKTMVPIHSVPHLPFDCYHLYAIPRPTSSGAASGGGGLLVVGNSVLIHVNNGSVAGITAVNGVERLAAGHYTRMNLDTAVNAHLNVTLDNAQVGMIARDVLALWTDRGQGYLVRLNETRRNHTEIYVQPIDTTKNWDSDLAENDGETLMVTPSCIVAIKPPPLTEQAKMRGVRLACNSLLFVGSSAGNSVLVGVRREQKPASGLPAPTALDGEAPLEQALPAARRTAKSKRTEDAFDEDTFLYGDSDGSGGEDDNNTGGSAEARMDVELQNVEVDRLLKGLGNDVSKAGEPSGKRDLVHWAEGYKLAIHDKLVGISPITQFAVGPSVSNTSGLASDDNLEVVACTGGMAGGSLSIMQRNIRLDVLSLFDIPSRRSSELPSAVWVAKAATTDKQDSSWMIISRGGEASQVFSVTDDIREVTTTGFETKRGTIAVGEVGDEAIQVHTSGVNVLGGDGKCLNSAEIAGTVVAAAIEGPYVLIKLEDGEHRLLRYNRHSRTLAPTNFPQSASSGGVLNAYMFRDEGGLFGGTAPAATSAREEGSEDDVLSAKKRKRMSATSHTSAKMARMPDRLKPSDATHAAMPPIPEGPGDSDTAAPNGTDKPPASFWLFAHHRNGDLAIYLLPTGQQVWKARRFHAFPPVLCDVFPSDPIDGSDGAAAASNGRHLEIEDVAGDAMLAREREADKQRRAIDQFIVVQLGDKLLDIYLMGLTQSSELILYRSFAVMPRGDGRDALQRLPIRFARINVDVMSYCPDYHKSSWISREQYKALQRTTSTAGGPTGPTSKHGGPPQRESVEPDTADNEEDDNSERSRDIVEQPGGKGAEMFGAGDGSMGDQDWEALYASSVKHQCPRLVPYSNVGGTRGVFVAGARPLFVIIDDKKCLRIHPLRIPDKYTTYPLVTPFLPPAAGVVSNDSNGAGATLQKDKLGNSGEAPMWRSHPQPVYSFSAFHSPALCSRGLALITQKGTLMIASLPTLGVDYGQPWPLRHLRVGGSAVGVGPLESIVYHEPSGYYGLITTTPHEFRLKESDPEKAAVDAGYMLGGSERVPLIPEYERKDLETTKVPPTALKFQLELMSPVGWETVDTFSFLPNEHVTNIKSLSLESKEVESGRKRFIVIGTTFMLGEEVATRGKVYIFEILEVVPLPGRPQSNRKLKLRFQKEYRGAVTALCEIRGHLAMSVGSKIYIQSFEDNENLVSVAFLDCQCYVTSLQGVKNFLLIGDIARSVWFAGFQEGKGDEPTKLQVLGMDYSMDLPVLHVDYMVNGYRLALLVADDSGNLHWFTYSPRHTRSFAGQKLLRRGEFHVGSNVTDIKRFWRGTGQHGRQVTVVSTASGGMYVLTSAQERTFKRMQLVSTRIVYSAPQHCALNPRAFRIVPAHLRADYNPQRVTIDGDLLNWQFVNLSADTQQKITWQVGTTVDRVLQELTEFDAQTDLF